MLSKSIKQKVSNNIQIGFLAINILLLATIVGWPIINGTNHTGYEPYYFIIPFCVTGVLSLVLIFFSGKKNKIASLEVLISLLGIILLFSYKQFNIMLNYNEWLIRGMPSRFEVVSTMPWSNSDLQNTETNVSEVTKSKNAKNEEVGIDGLCRTSKYPFRDYGGDIEIQTIMCDGEIKGYFKYDLHNDSIDLLEYKEYSEPICTNGTMNGPVISYDEALNLIRDLPYIQEYIKAVSDDDRVSIEFRVEIGEGYKSCNYWQIWVYELVADDQATHAVTIARYLVDSSNGDLWFKTDFTSHIIKVNWL
ncbi:hypothetical protein JW887_01740 [Candidatus Dojkabacteria bacterium]|nr:hypothetical protein [Candidatus Dojkabacteria bacterium]